MDQLNYHLSHRRVGVEAAADDNRLARAFEPHVFELNVSDKVELVLLAVHLTVGSATWKVKMFRLCVPPKAACRTTLWTQGRNQSAHFTLVPPPVVHYSTHYTIVPPPIVHYSPASHSSL